MRRRIFSIFIATGMVIFFAGLVHAYPLKAALNSLQVVPSYSSTARGFCNIDANYDSNGFGTLNFKLRCSFSGLSGGLTGADIRTARAGQNGDQYDCYAKEVWVTLPNNGTGSVNISCQTWCDIPGICVGSQAIPPSEAKNFYVVLQTSAFPMGEVRGQFKPIGLDSDVDGEGRTEISIFRPSDGYSYAYCSLNDSLITTHLEWNPQTDSDPFLADFDGDAIADLSFVRTNAGNGKMTVVYKQSKDGAVVYYPWSNSTYGDIPVFGDYNGDGQIDKAFFHPNEGNFYIYWSGDVYSVQHWGLPGDKPCSGDYDGDGITDLCIVRQENNQLVWYINQSSDGQYRRTDWGLTTDETYPNNPVDVDNDGANDLLVARIENGQRVFYALRSSDWSMFALVWGLPTDKVKIGDFDGDGTTDFASIREVNNQLVWFINQGSNGTRVVYWGLSGDK